jgi:hypothetical protein
MGFAAFEFVLGGGWDGPAVALRCSFVFFSHDIFLILFRSFRSLRLFHRTHASMIVFFL